MSRVQNSQLFHTVSAKGKEDGNEFTGRTLTKHPSLPKNDAMTIAEGDDEEEED